MLNPWTRTPIHVRHDNVMVMMTMKNVGPITRTFDLLGSFDVAGSSDLNGLVLVPVRDVCEPKQTKMGNCLNRRGQQEGRQASNGIMVHWKNALGRSGGRGASYAIFLSSSFYHISCFSME